MTRFGPIIERWKQTQNQLRQRMIISRPRSLPRFVAGADLAFSTDKSTVFAAAVVYDRQEKRIVEVVGASRPTEFPYIPGYLSFREGPALADAIAKLKHEYGAILFDGQGYAHPRRCGLATHMAVTLNVIGVGVAKSRLIGTYEDPPPAAGSASPLMDRDEQIGIVLRTQTNVRPLFVSVGNRIDLESAQRLVLACCTRYRLPEPTRQADIEVAKLKSRSAS